MVVLDASAVVALWLIEPGWERVEAVLSGAVLSTVNLAESIGRLERRGVASAGAESELDKLGVNILPLSRTVAVTAGQLAVATRSLGLSLGDRVCIVQAVALGLPVMTADRRLAAYGQGPSFDLIR